MTIQDVPTLNVIFNGFVFIFLISGWWAIKKKNRSLHKKFMLAAFASAIFFLIGYLYYHFNTQLMTPYKKQGILRYIYFTVLFTHIPAAAFSVVPIIMALRHAFKKNFEKHKRITAWLLPLWLYVSATGIIVYFMLYVF